MRHRKRGAVGFSSLACFVLLGMSDAVQAQAASSVHWRPEWQKVQPYGYIASAVFLGGTITIAASMDQRTSGSRRGILFDGAARRALRAETREGRDAARAVGDFGYRSLLVFPAIDAALAWSIYGTSEVAWQMLAMDIEVMSLAGLLGFFTDHFIGRARPSEAECERDPNYERFCNGTDEFGSFVSGHTLMSSAAAGATCAHHLSLPLYGGGGADILACVAATAPALTTGVARVISERHWATDVTVGWLLGGALGYLWPRLAHYGARPPDLKLTPVVTTWSIEAKVFGAF